MRIEKGDVIAGVSAIDLRRAFRNVRHMGYSQVQGMRDALGDSLSLTQEQRKALVEQLSTEGYITHEHSKYRLSEKGLRLAAASTGKPIPRKQADALVEAFVARAQEINRSESWYRIAQIEIFGSMLDDTREVVNDIDLMVTLAERYIPTDDDLVITIYRYYHKRTGKDNPSFKEALAFPYREVLRLLKGGKRAYSILSDTEHSSMRERTACKVIIVDHTEPVALPEDLRKETVEETT